MPWHKVSQGECLSSIAHHYGFAKWQTLYDAPENDDFRSLRPDPNVIFPGDNLFVPDRETKQVPCATEATHRFQERKLVTLLRLVIHDSAGKPMGGKKYRLIVEGVEFKGSLPS